TITLAEFQRDYYRFDSQDGQRFYINCYTSQLFEWRSNSAGAALTTHLQQNASSPLPRLATSDQEQAALNFATAHYPSFNALNMQLSAAVDDGYGNGYCHFESRLPGGGYFTGNSCHVLLDPFSGDVWDYYAMVAGPLSIPTQPQLTAAQAE